ncbi:hypothetical protein [Lentilactobacillus otakiensis]|nr:hypothetical protein [Lentilactobacillus otakiensis]MDV3519248.1 hypothetical protein [Lentilactobacillus otakiensis]
MKNEQKKSAEQRQLSNATQARLFANQNILYIKYKPRQSWVQRIMEALNMNEDEYYENMADEYEDPKPTQEELAEAEYAEYEDQHEDEMDIGGVEI